MSNERIEDFEIIDFISREQRLTLEHDFSVKWAQILEMRISGKGEGRGWGKNYKPIRDLGKILDM